MGRNTQAYFPAKEALLSMGTARESNKLQFVIQSLRVAGVLAVVPWGLAGACWGMVAAALGGALYSHLSLARLIGMRWRHVWQANWRSVIVSTFTGPPLMLGLASGPFTESNYIVGGALGAAASVIAWLAALRCTGHPLWPELQRLLPTAAAQRPGP